MDSILFTALFLLSSKIKIKLALILHLSRDISTRFNSDDHYSIFDRENLTVKKINK